MIYYKHHDFKLGPIIDEKILYNIDPNKTHFKISILDLNRDFIRFFEEKDLMISLIEVFKLDPVHKFWPIHADGPMIQEYAKMNFVIGNKESPMVWYKAKNEISKQIKLTATGSRYTEWELDEVEEVDRTFIQNGTLVQAGQPHTVYLKGYSTRWSVSISLTRYLKTCTFDTLAEIFKEYEC